MVLIMYNEHPSFCFDSLLTSAWNNKQFFVMKFDWIAAVQLQIHGKILG